MCYPPEKSTRIFQTQWGYNLKVPVLLVKGTTGRRGNTSREKVQLREEGRQQESTYSSMTGLGHTHTHTIGKALVEVVLVFPWIVL